jgi:phage virion morphogenesis protein
MLYVALSENDIEAIISVDKIEGAAREALSEATALILNRIRKAFLAQEDPDGIPWEPSFAAFKRSFTGRGGGTLYDTGNLFHSIQQYTISPLEQAIGTDVPYGQFHQYGTMKMPKREFLGFNEDDERLALNVMIQKVKAIL